jgi:UDP-galactopyranose mutase
MYDYVIVGCGPYGSTFARQMLDRGRSVLLVDRRDHLAGNCHTVLEEGIHVHQYGPHLFHTASRQIWEFVKQFGRWKPYIHRGLADAGGRLYSFPLNMMTYHQLWGVRTWPEARAEIDRTIEPHGNRESIEGWCLANLGREVYEGFIAGYTRKQWRRDPADLPATIVRRLEFRTTFDDRYFSDPYQGQPADGYTALFETMVDGAEVLLGVDYFEERRILGRLGRRLVYTGRIDEFFGYRHGELDYLSLRFAHERSDHDIQHAAVINYTSADVPWTRVIEHKHFQGAKVEHSIATREYPQEYDRTKEPFYPVRDPKNVDLYGRYAAEAEQTSVIFGGRLGSYLYLDMDAAIGQALARAAREP